MAQFDMGNMESPLPGSDFINNYLEPWAEAVKTLHSGNVRPSYIQANMMWLDTTTNPWVLKMFDGVDDIPVGSFNTTSNAFTVAGIGSIIQAYNAKLASLSGLTGANNKGLYFTGANALATFDLAAQGRTFLAATDVAAQLLALGIKPVKFTPTGQPGTNVTSVTPVISQYVLIGSYCQVSGRTAVNVSGAGDSRFTLSLPEVATLSNAGQLAGAGGSSTTSTNPNMDIYANTGTNTAQFVFQAPAAGTRNINYTYGFFLT